MPAKTCPTGDQTCGPANINVGADERQLSMVLGATILVGGTLLASTRTFLAAAVGLGLLYRGMTGHCMGYEALGISTADDTESAPREVTERIPVGAG